MNYNECKMLSSEFIKEYDIKSASDWFKKVNKSVFKLPYHPERKFKNNGWVDWYDWLSKDRDCRKYHVDDNFFKKKSKNMYYILGFFYADGYLDFKNEKFSITQNLKDKYLLERFLKEMKSNSVIRKHYSNNLQFVIKSKMIKDDLVNIGVCENKTFDIRFPFVEKEYISSFIRGFFDGDGCITYQKNEKCYVSSIVCASGDFLKKLFDVLVSFIPDFNGKIKKYGKYYYVNMGVNDTRRFGEFIYGGLDKNSLYIKRKHEKFLKSGDIKLSSVDNGKSFMNYLDAKNYIKNIGIKKYRKWRDYKKVNKINIPSNLDFYDQYLNWRDFIN